MQRPGKRVSKKWWEQEGLDLAGMRMAAALEREPDVMAREVVEG